jgi:hypothetical protein
VPLRLQRLQFLDRDHEGMLGRYVRLMDDEQALQGGTYIHLCFAWAY